MMTGHNWGAEHDTDIPECAPKTNGKYIMWPFAVIGYEKNNKVGRFCVILCMSLLKTVFMF